MIWLYIQKRKLKSRRLPRFQTLHRSQGQKIPYILTQEKPSPEGLHRDNKCDEFTVNITGYLESQSAFISQSKSLSVDSSEPHDRQAINIQSLVLDSLCIPWFAFVAISWTMNELLRIPFTFLYCPETMKKMHPAYILSLEEYWLLWLLLFCSFHQLAWWNAYQSPF